MIFINKLFIGIVVIILGLIAGWFGFSGKFNIPKTPKVTDLTAPRSNLTPTPSVVYDYTQEQISVMPGSNGSGEKGGMTGTQTSLSNQEVSLSENGFVPNVLTVRVGTTITWTNNSSKNMWVASALHPTHQELPGFDQLKAVGKGGQYSYEFTKVGTWKYHNHQDPLITGTVIVTQ